jgi:hypothetical protein
MPLLNPPDVLPEAMRFIVRALLASDGSLVEDELLRLVAPLGLVEAMSGEAAASPGQGQSVSFKGGGRIIATATLTAMRGANLLAPQSRGDHRVTLAQNVQDYFDSWDAVTALAFATFLREELLATAQEVFDEEDQNGGVEDLAFAIALLLAVPDPLSPITAFEGGDGKTLSQFQTAEFSDDIGEWIVRSGVRYAPLVRWVTYLGFARNFNSQGLFIVDPSGALEHLAVPVVKSQMSMIEFLDSLAAIMPYSDRGRIGASLRRSLTTNLADDQVSPGLALGLQTLHLKKRIQLVLLSDADSMEFPIGVDRSIRYSHIAPGATT